MQLKLPLNELYARKSPQKVEWKQSWTLHLVSATSKTKESHLEEENVFIKRNY